MSSLTVMILCGRSPRHLYVANRLCESARPVAVVQARYRGLVPDTFRVGAEVVATGVVGADGRLAAETIMAKCPSKYEVKGGPALAQKQAGGGTPARRPGR